MTTPVIDELHDRAARLDRFERVLARVFEQAQHDDLEQRARTILVGVASELKTASQALDVAAAALRDAGKGHEASRAKQAASRALSQAKGLVGE